MTTGVIVAAVDLIHKDADRLVITEALSLARTHDARIELIFVIPDQQHSYAQEYVPADMRDQVMVDARNDLGTYAAEFDWGAVPHDTQVLRGVVYEQILTHAKKSNADFIVIGASRPSLKDLLIGPNAARVSRNASCNVLVVRPKTN
jgi:nucleotide-binding universal stress UspA family protein